ncbi:hypothetical protein CEUSTIGMA_g12504.t1 [Chlamydomonas eustigma]|uniref:Uncharacterized protein n=1 Tax=Chlamydomonas eustigma TaxID=1157962 RepID=A0A250XPS2_9CHLO|nr:hypothetical protein CEUSTIGMA_g12504.t1 [Chlamydomonas eustigma]|eukprot:GAX85084.1 hypothetical protein CEUSTIGMA_g12504.t1 [Chlamydomonas eustigma]
MSGAASHENGGASQEDSFHGQGTRLPFDQYHGQVGTHANQGSYNQVQQPSSNGMFSSYSFGGNSSHAGSGQSNFNSSTMIPSGNPTSMPAQPGQFGGDQEPSSKRQRQVGPGESMNGAYPEHANNSMNGNSIPQQQQQHRQPGPTSSEVFMFSRPGGAQNPGVRPITQTHSQNTNNMIGMQNNMNAASNASNLLASQSNNALQQLLAMASQPNLQKQLQQQQQQQNQMQQQIQNQFNLQLGAAAQLLNNKRLEGIQSRPLQHSNMYTNLLNGGLGGGGLSSGNNLVNTMLQQQHQPGISPMMQQLLLQRQQQLQLQQQQAALQQQAEPEEEDKEEDILAKVGKISDKLRSMLGKGVSDRFAGTDEEAAAAAAEGASSLSQPLVKREHLIEACGQVAGTLKSYQLVGINFLMMLHKSESVGGAILADEMGLGKTAQTISFLGVLRTLCNVKSPHLIICPASLIQNWAREFRQWCPGMRIILYHGKDRDSVRQALQRWRKRVRLAYKEGTITELPPGMTIHEDDEVLDEAADAQRYDDEFDEAPDYGDEEEEELQDPAWDDSRPVGGLVLPGETSGEAAFDIMITTYTLFEREGGYKHDRSFLQKWKWSYLVADEAHALKNRSSIRTRKLRKLAVCCENRILLTGTPLQNSLEELRALLEFLMPSLFIEPGHENEDDTVSMKKLDEDEQAARVDRYKALLAPFILRRLKSEVATQLVPKKHIVEEVEMTPAQSKLYKAAVESMRREVAAATTVVTTAKPRGRPKKVQSSGAAAAGPETNLLVAKLGSQRVNNIFTHLRKVAQHPLLVRNIYTDAQVDKMADIASSHGLFSGNCTFDRVQKELLSYSDHQLHVFSSTWPAFMSEFILDSSALMSSAKVRSLDELLPRLFAQGSKVLLFSQWTMTLDLLEWYMNLKGFSYVRLDGSTQVEDRLSIVDKFNDPSKGVFVFLLSTRAGGQGLNLTGADVVVLHDVDFNPQVDRQAEDRCHRLGQTKPVTVYRMVTKSTVDQNVLSIAERKLALDAAVLNDVTITGGDEESGAAEVDPGKPKRGRPGLDSKEVRHMGAILSALLSEE